jgi:hypothetical protein
MCLVYACMRKARDVTCVVTLAAWQLLYIPPCARGPGCCTVFVPHGCSWTGEGGRGRCHIIKPNVLGVAQAPNCAWSGTDSQQCLLRALGLACTAETSWSCGVLQGAGLVL